MRRSLPELAVRLSQFGALLADWLELKGQLPLDDLIDRVLEDIKYQAYLGIDEDRWANVMELRGVSQEFSELGLVDFLQQVALVSDQDTLTERPERTHFADTPRSQGVGIPGCVHRGDG